MVLAHFGICWKHNASLRLVASMDRRNIGYSQIYGILRNRPFPIFCQSADVKRVLAFVVRIVQVFFGYHVCQINAEYFVDVNIRRYYNMFAIAKTRVFV
jgi:hypothetical protein